MRIFQILTKEISELRSNIRGQGIIDIGLPEDICSQKPWDDWFLGYSPGFMCLQDIYFTIQPSSFLTIIHIYISPTHANIQAHDLHYTCTLSLCLVTGDDFVNRIINIDPLSNSQCWEPWVIVKPHGKKLLLSSYTLNVFKQQTKQKKNPVEVHVFKIIKFLYYFNTLKRKKKNQ